MSYLFYGDDVQLNDIYKRKNKNRRTLGLSVQRIDGKALSILIYLREMTPEEVAEKSRISVDTINNYINGEELLIDILAIQRLTDVLKCDPVDILLVKGEKSPVYKKELPSNGAVGLYDGIRPKPDFKEGKVYRIRPKTKGYQPHFKSYIFCGKQKGKDVTHYLFRSLHGGYYETFSEVSIMLKEQEIQNG